MTGSNQGRWRSQRARSLQRRGRRRRPAPPGKQGSVSRAGEGHDAGKGKRMLAVGNHVLSATNRLRRWAKHVPRMLRSGRWLSGESWLTRQQRRPMWCSTSSSLRPPVTAPPTAKRPPTICTGPNETGAAHQGRSAAQTRPRGSRAASQRGELVGRNRCSRSAEMYALREGC
jgi:hypothetical protein